MFLTYQRSKQDKVLDPSALGAQGVLVFSERAGELPGRDDPALPGRDERLQLRLHPGSGV